MLLFFFPCSSWHALMPWHLTGLAFLSETFLCCLPRAPLSWLVSVSHTKSHVFTLTQHLLEDFLVLTGPFSMPLIKNKALLTPLTISWVIQMFSRLQFPPVHVNSTSHPYLSFRAPDFISCFLINISTWTSGAQAPSRVAGSCSAHWGYFSSGAPSLHA